MIEYKKILSPYYNPRGDNPIWYFTPHCMPGLLSAETCANIFTRTNPPRNGSSNWCIGKSGDYVLSVEESNRAWTSDSRLNDYHAITVECASDLNAPYKFPDATYNALIELAVDVMKRYGKKKMLYFPDKSTAMNYSVRDDEIVLTRHNFFANVDCPGKWFIDKSPEFVSTVNQRISGITPTKELYHVQIGAFSIESNAKRMLDDAKNKGFKDAFIVKY